MTVSTHLQLAEAGWRWTLDQVRYDEDGPWIPLTPDATEPAWDRDGMHSGIGGLAHALAVISRTRAWTTDEAALAAAIGERLRALGAPGVAGIASEPPAAWVHRCLHSLRTSGIPERLRPGFWDNDGRCCGTAGVGAAVLGHDPAFARRLADTLVDRAYVERDRAWWRFLEHRDDHPLHAPGVGWMQGAAGIAAYLFEVALSRAAAGGRPSPSARRCRPPRCGR